MAHHPPIDLALVFREHARGLAGAVRGVLGPGADVSEVLQDAFLKAWRSLDRARPPSDPVAWVFVLTLNLARDAGRRRRLRATHRELDEVDDVRLQSPRSEPLPHLAARETLAAARAAIHALPEAERAVFLLRSSAELPFGAVARELGIPVGTAKTRMRSALRELRERLAAHAPVSGVRPDPTATEGGAR